LNGVIANRRVISPNSVAFGTDTIWKYLCMYLDQASALFLYFVIRIRRRRKKFTFAISSADEFLVSFLKVVLFLCLRQYEFRRASCFGLFVRPLSVYTYLTWYLRISMKLSNKYLSREWALQERFSMSEVNEQLYNSQVKSRSEWSETA